MPEEELDLLNKEVILTILSETSKSEDKDRRRLSFNAYQVYSGNQKVYVERMLARTRPNGHGSYTISNISVSKMVTDKRAAAYNEAPIRSVDGNQDKTEFLTQIYNEANGSREMQFHDVVFNLNKYDLMWVNYREKEERFQFICLHPYEFVLVRDKDTGKVLVVGMNYPSTEITQNARGQGVEGTVRSGDGISDLIAESQSDSAAEGETWVFWSDTQHVKIRTTSVKVIVAGEEKLKKSIEYVDIEGNPRNVNPLGILPFVLTTSDTAIDYPTVNSLTEQSITFNAQQSETLTAKNLHGTGIQSFKYPERMQGRFKNMTHGQTEAIHLPQSGKEGDAPTEFEYHTSGAQLIPMMENDMNLLRQIMQEHEVEGMKMDLADSNATSGISRAIAGSSVQKVIERNQQIYAETEKSMFEIIKAWDRFNGTRMFGEEDELQIVYPKPKVMVSDKETLENIQKLLDLGLIEEWEKFIKMDPNLSEEQAREKLERIEKRREEKAQKMLSRGLDGNQQDGINQESEAQPQGSNDEREGES